MHDTLDLYEYLIIFFPVEEASVFLWTEYFMEMFVGTTGAGSKLACL